MNWRDFFYFSKGERMALFILLCLIAIAGILFLTSERKVMIAQNSAVSGRDTIRAVSASSPSIGGKLPDKEKTVRKETVSGRIGRLHQLYAPYPKQEKFPKGTVVELNVADTTILKKVPGIGSYFARKIIKFRDLLGGYASVNQLREVYGMDEERFQSIAPWFCTDTALIKKWPVNRLPADSLRRHPYLNYGQIRILLSLRRRKGKINGWENLKLLEEFTEADSIRLIHYLSFD